MGVRPDQAVAIVPLNDLPSLATIVAALRIGCAALLLSPADPANRLQQQVDALGVRTILCSPDLDGGRYLDAVAAPDPVSLPTGASPDVVLDPTADALYFGTSGSTAASKLVAQTHYNAVANFTYLRRGFAARATAWPPSHGQAHQTTR